MPAEAPEFSCGWIYRRDVWFLAGPRQLALIHRSLWDEGERFCPWLLCARWEFVLKRKIKMHQSGERQDDKGVTPKPDFYGIVESSHPRSFALKSHLLSLMNQRNLDSNGSISFSGNVIIPSSIVECELFEKFFDLVDTEGFFCLVLLDCCFHGWFKDNGHPPCVLSNWFAARMW